ncbi:hypothetical protein ACLGIH_20415 [Streptomyces sp. HMX87]|uniref:hypothetical protein n=1 Tax=Streptomyces sp. HMX87 TaxID=3390849 RepID=UPI003A888B08
MIDRSDETHTYDGVEITAGLKVFNYYDQKWGVVTQEQFERNGDIDPGGKHFNGWYDVQHDDGSTVLLNGHRMSTVNPNGGPKVLRDLLKF